MDSWTTHNIVGQYIGNHRTIAIQNFELAKELFNKDEWCGRGLNFITRFMRSDSGTSKVLAGKISFPLNFYFLDLGNYHDRWTSLG